MKFRRHIFFFTFVILVVLLIFCVPKVETLEKTEGISESRIICDEGVRECETKKTRLKSALDTNEANLIVHFGKNEWSKIAGLLGDTASITLPDGRIYVGGLEIADFFKGKKREAQQPDVRVTFVFNFECALITDIEDVEIGGKRFGDEALIKFKFRINTVREGTIKNQRGDGSGRYRHTTSCEWEPI